MNRATEYPGVQTQRHQRADGSVRAYHYYRSTGALLPGEPGSLEFETAYALAHGIASSIEPEPRKRRVRRGERYVYFVHCPELRRVKIGSSSTPYMRFQGIQCGCPAPVALMGAMPDTGNLERELHKRFAALRVHGEWHTESDELLAYIKAHAQPCKRERMHFSTKTRRYFMKEVA